jgi:hypothetical protein
MSAAAAAVLLSGDLYKQTVAFDYVVKRHVKLYRNRFETYSDLAVPDDHRSFELDASARLLPDSREQIQQKKRYLRPRGVGSMTALAAVRGKGAELLLVSLRGYSTTTRGSGPEHSRRDPGCSAQTSLLVLVTAE